MVTNKAANILWFSSMLHKQHGSGSHLHTFSIYRGLKAVSARGQTRVEQALAGHGISFLTTTFGFACQQLT